jgi:hypothetical protein
MRTAIRDAVLGVAIAACAACSYYGGIFVDCEIACTPSTGCPPGFTCSASEGLCRSGATTPSCAAIFDGGPDAPGADAFDPSVCPTTYAISLPSTTSRYRLASGGLDWTHAIDACVADQTSPKGFTHLVVFTKRQEQTELEAIVGDVWVGYSDRLVEGEFRATTLEPIGNYVAPSSPAWAFGEPNHQTTAENCDEVILEGGLNDNNCANTRMFVCECDSYANDPSRY